MGRHCRKIADTGMFSLAYEHTCVKSAEKTLDLTAFVASWMVAVEVENNVGVSFHTIDGCFKVTRR